MNWSEFKTEGELHPPEPQSMFDAALSWLSLIFLAPLMGVVYLVLDGAMMGGGHIPLYRHYDGPQYDASFRVAQHPQLLMFLYIFVGALLLLCALIVGSLVLERRRTRAQNERNSALRERSMAEFRKYMDEKYGRAWQSRISG